MVRAQSSIPKAIEPKRAAHIILSGEELKHPLRSETRQECPLSYSYSIQCLKSVLEQLVNGGKKGYQVRISNKRSKYQRNQQNNLIHNNPKDSTKKTS